MRLISQDGMIDVPYENTIINCERNRTDSYTIYAETSHCFGLAVYTTEAKVLKVMEMLREDYLETVYDYRTRPKVFIFPKDVEIEV